MNLLSKKVYAINDVKEIPLNDYITFTDDLVERIGSLPGVKSIYQLGGWSQPGISDIDLIVVVDSEKVYSSNISLSKQRLCCNNSQEYMLMHSPFVVPDSIFSKIDWIFYCSDLKHRFGQELEYEISANDFKISTELYKLVSVLFHTLPRFKLIQNGGSLRSFLTFAYSLKHTYNILKQFDCSFESKYIVEYIDKMTELRRNVIENNLDFASEVDISERVAEGIETCKLLAGKVESLLLEKYSDSFDESTDFYYYKNKDVIFHFAHKYKNIDMEMKKGFVIVKASPVFAVTFLCPSKNMDLNINVHQKKAISGNFNLKLSNPEDERHYRKIKLLIEEYSTLFKKSNIYHGMPFELNTPSLWQHIFPSYKRFLSVIKRRIFKIYSISKYRGVING